MSTSQEPKARGNLVRGLLILALAAVVGYGLWRPKEAVADGIFPDAEHAEELLLQRFAAYTDLRVKDDWVSIYQMVDPHQREQMGIDRFLTFYGRGMLKTHTIETHEVSIDELEHSAVMRVTTDAELNVQKLPRDVRSSLRVDDPADLRRAMDHNIFWVWRDNEWYFCLEQAVLSGREASGREVIPF